MHSVCHDDVVTYYECVMKMSKVDRVRFGTNWHRMVGHNVAGGRNV